MNMIEVVGKKDAVGKPLLFGTTDEFLKRFSLSDLSDLPSFESLTDRIQTIATPGGDSQLFDMKSNENINFEETSPKEEIPEFLRGEDVDVIE